MTRRRVLALLLCAAVGLDLVPVTTSIRSAPAAAAPAAAPRTPRSVPAPTLLMSDVIFDFAGGHGCTIKLGPPVVGRPKGTERARATAPALRDAVLRTAPLPLDAVPAADAVLATLR